MDRTGRRRPVLPPRPPSNTGIPERRNQPQQLNRSIRELEHRRSVSISHPLPLPRPGIHPRPPAGTVPPPPTRTPQNKPLTDPHILAGIGPFAGRASPVRVPAPGLTKFPMMTAVRSGIRRRCLCFIAHIVPQTYDKFNTCIPECENNSGELPALRNGLGTAQQMPPPRTRQGAGARGRIRTCGLPLRRRLLYPLSYAGGRESRVPESNR